MVVTKLDGTARAGFVVSIVSDLGVPVKLIGVGESLSDLRDFEAVLFVDSLLGYSVSFLGNPGRGSLLEGMGVCSIADSRALAFIANPRSRHPRERGAGAGGGDGCGQRGHYGEQDQVWIHGLMVCHALIEWPVCVYCVIYIRRRCDPA